MNEKRCSRTEMEMDEEVDVPLTNIQRCYSVSPILVLLLFYLSAMWYALSSRMTAPRSGGDAELMSGSAVRELLNASSHPHANGHYQSMILPLPREGQCACVPGVNPKAIQPSWSLCPSNVSHCVQIGDRRLCMSGDMLCSLPTFRARGRLANVAHPPFSKEQQQLWRRIYERQFPANCTGAKFRAFSFDLFENKKLGFGVFAKIVAGMFTTSFDTGAIFTILPEEFPIYGKASCGGWECLFHPVTNCSLPNNARTYLELESHPDVEILSWGVKGEIGCTIDPTGMHPAQRMAVFARFLFEPRDASYLRFREFSRPNLAIHVRRTDKITETPFRALHEYLSVVTASQCPLNVYVATDDPHLESELMQYRGGCFDFRLMNTERPAAGAVQVGGANYDDMFAEIMLLVSADRFVGMSQSNFARLIAMMRGDKVDDANSRDLDGNHYYNEYDGGVIVY